MWDFFLDRLYYDDVLRFGVALFVAIIVILVITLFL